MFFLSVAWQWCIEMPWLSSVFVFCAQQPRGFKYGDNEICLTGTVRTLATMRWVADFANSAQPDSSFHKVDGRWCAFLLWLPWSVFQQPGTRLQVAIWLIRDLIVFLFRLATIWSCITGICPVTDWDASSSHLGAAASNATLTTGWGSTSKQTSYWVRISSWYTKYR